MANWRETYLELFSSADTDTVLFERLAKSVVELGFEHCSFGLRIPLPVSAPSFSLLSNYPDRWVQHYVANDYFLQDPTVKHGLTESMPLQWSATTQQDHHEFWEEAQQHGLSHGWCMPCHGKYGLTGMLSLVRSGEALDEAELNAKELQMAWISKLVHGAMTQLIAPKLMPECDIELTAREREILRWTATGKTYLETGMILGIDDRTVKFHLVNTMRKLNAANKTEAAIKASMLGMLF
ncbi:LuxR family transcriptional regulator [Chitinimonas viridis]|uniref:LuxR family transcriptional regulator n=1 Tax=Chitinimonas viridis TaxID=664880 RepID=A0ABT8B7U2_9NEIS|nr:LuxR family transcriptional regulator [Chitinimonas viridis]MDN3578334.1 LuxR family transcriptional regulator [Chitinimonas viridis]